MRTVAIALVCAIGTIAASGYGQCTTTLGFGVVGIKLIPSLKLVQHTGWESNSYDVLQSKARQRLLLIYLGNNWTLSRGKYPPANIGQLDGVQLITEKHGLYTGTILLHLPKRSADRQLVYDFKNLNESQYDVARTLIQSTCLR